MGLFGLGKKKEAPAPEAPVTAEQVKLVQDSWAMVEPISDKAAELFYGRLFETAPEVQSLFKGDMKEQGKKLMQMITVAVKGLTNLEAIVPAVQELGKRHVKYDVKEEHYAVVGASLLWTLEQGLGEAFSPDTKEAWTAVYGVLSNTMIDAAKTV
jgi:nitric oxide dioxygenase